MAKLLCLSIEFAGSDRLGHSVEQNLTREWVEKRLLGFGGKIAALREFSRIAKLICVILSAILSGWWNKRDNSKWLSLS